MKLGPHPQGESAVRCLSDPRRICVGFRSDSTCLRSASFPREQDAGLLGRARRVRDETGSINEGG